MNALQQHQQQSSSSRGNADEFREYKKQQEMLKRTARIEKETIRYLNGQLALRPHDFTAIEKLTELHYNRKDYIATYLSINRLIQVNRCTSSSYIRLGKCYFLRWMKDWTDEDLEAAGRAYHSAFKCGDLMKKSSLPMQHLEMFSILIRLGECQGALDILGLIVSHFKDEGISAWMCIVQYNIAQVLLLLGKIDEAFRLYQDLFANELLIEIDVDSDTIFCNSKRIINSYISLEVCRLLQLQGDHKLAKHLYRESFDRIFKYGCSKKAVDFRFNHVTFEHWYNDYRTFKKLGDLFKSECNFVMAAEMYSYACEMIASSNKASSGWDNITSEDRAAFLSYLLDKGECLALFRQYNQSEACAFYAYRKAPMDIVIVARAARCCDPLGTSELSRKILKHSYPIFRSVKKIVSLLFVKVARRRRLNEDKKHYYASQIASVIRMCLVRNRELGLRLSNVHPATRIGPLIRYCRRVCLFKSGKEVLDDWVEVWNLHANCIQRNLKLSLQRKRYYTFWHGVKSLKCIIQGQQARMRLRRSIQSIQDRLDQDQSLCEETNAQNGCIQLYGINYYDINRLSTGVMCMSNDANSDHNFNIVDDQYMLRMLPRSYRKMPVVQTPLPSTLISASLLSSHISNSSESKHDGSSPSIDYPSTYAEKGQGLSWFMSNPMALNSKQCRSPDRRYYAEGAASAKVSISSNTANDTTMQSVDHTSSKHTQSELLQELNACQLSGEDVISLVSIRSVFKDSTVQWVPFGILPDASIIRLLTCTSLVLTSPSFSMSDSKRLCSIARKTYTYEKRTKCHWDNVTSLLIYGTRMGSSGLLSFINLGVNKLTSLSIGYANFDHHCSRVLSYQLIDKHRPTLLKLYIEGELKFGDRGAVELFKYLQYNSTLKLLSIRECGLTGRSALAFARYLVISQSLECAILNDNHFTYDNVLTVTRAVANKGAKGCFKSVSMLNQSHALNKKQLLRLLDIASTLLVRIVSNDIETVDEYEQEVERKKKYVDEGHDNKEYKDIDDRNFKDIAGVMRELAVVDRLQDGINTTISKTVYL